MPNISGGCRSDLKISHPIMRNSTTLAQLCNQHWNGRDVWLFLALMAISCSIRSPRLMLLLEMIDPRHAALGWRRMDSF
ncbi:hypothetical protein H5410_004854 [Solanum commersonii]|uniref:Uncharacterized protein n=1 Tax=Solanum commersonii TaxID=4109 RepID=A0A9J6A605_SOLCO|nr:hypothetical protein H5410_004854 [Solanum commersonii]